MKLIDVMQGSDEWKQLRFNYHTASEAPIMMGCSKQVKRNDLLHIKSTGDQIQFSEWVENVLFERGHEIEQLARPLAEAIVGDSLYPIVGIDDSDYLLASFDGMTMEGNIIWECKQYNESKVQAVLNNKIPEEDLWQVVQQMIVSDAEKCLYMVSDGTELNTIHCWYELNFDHVNQLLKGWKQFDEDLKNYSPREVINISGKAPKQLPILMIEVTGAVKTSNLKEFKLAADTILQSINTNLKTDSDFANAEKTVKWCKDVETKLDDAKAQALNQTKTIAELFSVIDQIREETRTKRLELNKLVDTRKKAIRYEIQQEAMGEIKNLQDKIHKRLDIDYFPDITPDFAKVMYGKKTIESIQSAVDDLVAKTKIEMRDLEDIIFSNLHTYKLLALDHQFLFKDLETIIIKPIDDFRALVKLRIAEHKEQEQQKIQNNINQKRIEENRKKESQKQADSILPNKPSNEDIIKLLTTYYKANENTVLNWLIDLIQTMDHDYAKKTTA